MRRRPTFLPKRIFDRFCQEIRDRTPPGRGLARCFQGLHQLTAEPAPPAAHRRHSIHQQNQPQQAPTDSTNEDTTARNGTELPTPRKYRRFYYIFSIENFSDFPGLVLFRPARHCAALLRRAIEKINANLYSIDRQQKRDSNITLFVFDTNGTAPGRIGTYIFFIFDRRRG